MQIFMELHRKFHNVNIAINSNLYKKSSDIELSLLFKKIIIDKRFCLNFVFIDNQPVGYFLLTIVDKKEDILTKSEKYILVEQIFLEEDKRNSGIARKMALEIARIAKKADVCKIEAEVLFENKTSLNFLKNLGGKIKSIKMDFDLNNNPITKEMN